MPEDGAPGMPRGSGGDIARSPHYARAFAVHVFTTLGAALALVALIAAVGHQWELMFLCLGAALVVDGVDGTMARKFNVAQLLPRWSGDTLDLVVDFVTYVFVPAYAIAASGLLPGSVAIPAGIAIVMTGALYFADRNMKTDDNYFRGFPTLWNAVALYLFVLKPVPWIGALAVGTLAVLTFVPFKFVHPFRVTRLRVVTIAALVLWSVLAAYALWKGLDPGPWVAASLALIAVYFVGIGLTEKR